jgi:GT2 family glycosyltransferase
MIRRRYSDAMPTRVSVVIVAWRSRDIIVGCLRSIQAHPPSGPWQVVVVDNSSGDGTVEELRTEFPWVHVVANPSNRGLSAANNQGLLASTGDVVVISNPDVRFTAGALDEMAALFERHPRAAFAVPRMRQADGHLQVGAGDLPTLREALLGRQIAARREHGGFWWQHWEQDEERPIGHGNDACYAVRRSALVELGPQDERFPLDWEAIDWSARAWENGWEVWFCPTAEVVHLGGTSIAQARMRWVLLSHLGMYRYFAARVGAARRALVAVAVAARAVAKLLTVLAGVSFYAHAHRAARGPSGRAALQSAAEPPAAPSMPDPDPGRPDVSFVVVTWRSRDDVLACLESVHGSPPSGRWEVVVVDNGSDDGTAAAVAAAYPGVQVVANADNRGLARANNQGLLCSRGRVVVISNPDVGFGAGAVDAMVDLLHRRPRAAAVVPQVRLPDGGVQSVAGDLPTLPEAMFGRIVQRVLAQPGRMHGYCWDGWAHDEETRVGRAGDVCYAVRRDALVEVGMQDERFPLDWEGIDWSARAADLGWEVWFTPDACVTHLLGGSTRQAAPLWRVWTVHRGMYRYYRKRLSPLLSPLLATVFAGRAVLKSLVVATRLPLHEWSRRAQRVSDRTASSGG